MKMKIKRELQVLSAFVTSARLSSRALLDIARRVVPLAQRIQKCQNCGKPLWKSHKQKFCVPKCAERWHDRRKIEARRKHQENRVLARAKAILTRRQRG